MLHSAAGGHAALLTISAVGASSTALEHLHAAASRGRTISLYFDGSAPPHPTLPYPLTPVLPPHVNPHGALTEADG